CLLHVGPLVGATSSSLQSARLVASTVERQCPNGPPGRYACTMRASKREKDSIRSYVESRAHETVIHLEKVASELVGPVRHDIWDVHCADSRWWLVTEPTNL